MVGGKFVAELRGGRCFGGLLFAVLCVALLGQAQRAEAVVLPSGFAQQTVYSGLTRPTAIEFAPDGRAFVAEKSGLIDVFDGPEDTTPTVVADLRTQVHNFWDRGLLDIALDPDFTNHPYLYALYTHDAPIGGNAPTWGEPGESSDDCPTPPGPTLDGCVVSGRLSRFPLNGDTAGNEQVLVEDWCQQYPSHSVGSIAFDSDGALLASAGEGANFDIVAYGQGGDPPNPCGDPPNGVGGTQTSPTAEGGALRSQDLRTSGDPVGLDGSVIRVDRTDGSPLPDNPNAGMADVNARRIVAEGLRNPFRIAVRPGTSEVWVGDVGWGIWEEINSFDPDHFANFGWPCYEGAGRQGAYESTDLNICQSLYQTPAAVQAPVHAYDHDAKVVAGEDCPVGSSSISGLAFYDGGPFPPEYDDALFFADYSRGCIWVMKAGSNGRPDPGQIETFVDGTGGSDSAKAVNLTVGDDGALYYPDFDTGEIVSIRYYDANQPPTAAVTADPRFGDAPLTVQFDGSGSGDPDPGDTLSYAWDLDDDGQFDDSTDVAPSRTFLADGTHLVKLRVTDSSGASDVAALSIQVGNSPPTATIDTPAASLTWAVGDRISFSGSANDQEQGALGANALDWQLIMHHCPSNCHTHPIQDWDGVDGGTFSAPDHEYPSHLELKLTATDAGGLSDTKSIDLDPRTVELTMKSTPAGASLALGADSGPAPFGRPVIVGSSNSISAETSFQHGGQTYKWESWAHGGDRQQTVVAPSSDTTYRAVYRDISPPETTIDTHPSDPDYRADAKFRFSSSEDGSHFVCRVDGGGFAPCTSPYRALALVDGTHTFEVQAIDGTGNADPSPATYSWTVDTTPSNGFTLGRLKRNAKRGVAILAVKLPGPGLLELSGGGVVAKTKRADEAGRTRLPVKPRGRARKKLKRTGVAKLRLVVRFTPAGGSSARQKRVVKLRKR